MTLFLPETKSFPLPRSILQIEAMPTTIGKKLRSRKVQLACERRQNQYAATAGDSTNRIYLKPEEAKTQKSELNNLLTANEKNRSESRISSKTHDTANNKSASSSKDQLQSTNANSVNDDDNKQYDTVTSVHDIEQDDHHYYPNPNDQNKLTSSNTLNPHSIATSLTNLNLNIKKQLTKIIEVPSKNITRNNSIENIDIANSKL